MNGEGRLAPLRQRNFRWFFFGETINTAGSSMSSVALAFAVLSIHNSASAVGLVFAAATIPMVVFMLVGGAVADRLPRALVLRGCNLIEGITQFAAAILVLTGTAQIWELVVLQFISGTASAVSYPAFHGMVPMLLPEADRKAAFLLLGQAQSLLSIAGPALAGILVAVSSPGWALAIDSATFFIAAVFLTLLRLPAHSRPERRETVLGDLAAGWGFARHLGWVLPASSCALAFNALMSGALWVLGPVIANETVGSDGWGFARSAEALGVFSFAFVLVRFTFRRPMVACMYGFLVMGLPMVALGLYADTPVLVAAFFVAGCGLALLNLAWNMTVQEKVPEHMLSRIMAIDGFFSFVGMPVGQLAVGPLAHTFGNQAVELGAAGLCVVTCIVGVTRPAIRDLRMNGPDAAAIAREA